MGLDPETGRWCRRLSPWPWGGRAHQQAAHRVVSGGHCSHTSFSPEQADGALASPEDQTLPGCPLCASHREGVTLGMRGTGCSPRPRRARALTSNTRFKPRTEAAGCSEFGKTHTHTHTPVPLHLAASRASQEGSWLGRDSGAPSGPTSCRTPGAPTSGGRQHVRESLPGRHHFRVLIQISKVLPDPDGTIILGRGERRLKRRPGWSGKGRRPLSWGCRRIQAA